MRRPRTVADLLDDLIQYPRDTPLVYSSDEEGNTYSPVYYDVSFGIYGKWGEFRSMDFAKQTNFKGTTVLCIN